jgi:hypothetical protein
MTCACGCGRELSPLQVRAGNKCASIDCRINYRLELDKRDPYYAEPGPRQNPRKVRRIGSVAPLLAREDVA